MMEYILKSSVALAVTYLLYYVFARKNASFKWLRVYFLTAMVISFTLPALKYLPDFHRQNIVSVPSVYVPMWIEEHVTVSASSPDVGMPFTKTGKSRLPLSDIIKYAYAAGFLFLLLRFIYGLSHLVWLAAKNSVRKVNKDYLVFVKNLPAPFSFFQLIFIDRDDITDSHKTAMLQHERIHVRQWHSIDLLLLEFITMVQWFNPFAWLTRRALKEIHEYLADDGVVKGPISSLDYQHLLFVQACGLNSYLPVNGFKNSLTKKRILMISNNKRNRKWFAVFTLLAAVIIVTDSLSRINVAQDLPVTKKTAPASPIANVTPKNTQVVKTKTEVLSTPTPAPAVKKDLIPQSSPIDNKEESIRSSPQVLTDEIPLNWFKAGSNPQSYVVGIDKNTLKNGHKSVFLQSKEEQIAGFGTLMQTCNAKDYTGKRIKMTGYLKCENVKDWSGMWLRVDSKNKMSLSFDNMQDRPVKGTMDWTKCVIVLDVPSESNTINFGFLLYSIGKVWFADISFQVVDESEPLTNKKMGASYPDKPTNIDFEK